MGEVIFVDTDVHKGWSKAQTLQRAAETVPEQVMILGYDANNNCCYQSSTTSIKEMLYLLERIKQGIMSTDGL